MKDIKVENRIGDAIVHRIIRAHREKTPWKCCIMIPLLPGFTFPIDHPDASAVRHCLLGYFFATLIPNFFYLLQIRIILECQNRTISRGPNSAFSRLRKEGIDVCIVFYARQFLIVETFSLMSTSLCSLYAIGQRCEAIS